MNQVILKINSNLNDYAKYSDDGGSFEILKDQLESLKTSASKIISARVGMSGGLISSPIFSILGVGSNLSIGARLYGLSYDELENLPSFAKELITEPLDLFIDQNNSYEGVANEFIKSISSGEISPSNPFLIDMDSSGNIIAVDNSGIQTYLEKTNSVVSDINNDFDKFYDILKQSLASADRASLDNKRKNMIIRNVLNSATAVVMPGIFGRATPAEYFQKVANELTSKLEKINTRKMTIEAVLLGLRIYQSLKTLLSSFNSLVSGSQTDVSIPTPQTKTSGLIVSAVIDKSIFSSNLFKSEKKGSFYIDKKSSADGIISLVLSETFYNKIKRTTSKHRANSFFKMALDSGEVSFSSKLDLTGELLIESASLSLQSGNRATLSFKNSKLKKAKEFFESKVKASSAVISFKTSSGGLEIYAENKLNINKKAESATTTSYYKTKTPSGETIKYTVTDLVQNSGLLVDPKTKKKFKPKFRKSKPSSLSDMVSKWKP
jgi:hypothetical protein